MNESILYSHVYITYKMCSSYLIKSIYQDGKYIHPSSFGLLHVIQSRETRTTSVVVFIVLRRAVTDNEIESLHIYHGECNKIINCNETTVDYNAQTVRYILFLFIFYSSYLIPHSLFCLYRQYTFVLNLI